MRWLMVMVLLLPILLLGCGGGAYKISKEEYRDRVRTLGVLPLMLDEGSTIRYPQRQELLALLRQHNSGKHEKLAELLRADRNYFDVRTVSGDPQALFSRLVKGSVLRGEGDALYRRYLFDGAAASQVASENIVDGLLVLVANGVERIEKRRDRGTSLSYLEAPYNSVLITAAVVLPSGEIAWEYAGHPGAPFLPLQYPDFEEAHFNNTDEVKVKFVSLPGLERVLTERAKGVMVRDPFPASYLAFFDRIASSFGKTVMNPLKRKEGAAPPQAAPENR